MLALLISLALVGAESSCEADARRKMTECRTACPKLFLTGGSIQNCMRRCSDELRDNLLACKGKP